MDHLDLFYRLSVALSIGLLIGIERGRTMSSESEGERTAGLRTLGLSGLLGGTCAALATRTPAGGMVLAAGLAAYAAIIGLYRYREVEHRKTYGTTTVIAGLLSFALGGLAVVADPTVAAAAGIATTALLAMKSVLHGWLRRMTFEELRAGLTLLAMSVILLPILPDRGYGPLAALNPYDLWRMTVLIAAVSALGYLAIKLFDGTRGISLSAIAGGLVSSTAVTVSFAQMAKKHPDKEGLLAGGALLAGAVMMVRILLVAGSINLALLSWLLLPLLFAALALGALAAFYMFRHASDVLETPIALSSPFELGSVLKFGAFLAFIMVAAKALTIWGGSQGAYVLAAVSGIADVDALTLSMSRLGGQGLPLQAAAIAILIAAAVNSTSKAALGWAGGGPGPGKRLALGAAAAILAGGAGFALSGVVDPMLVYNTLAGGA